MSVSFCIFDSKEIDEDDYSFSSRKLCRINNGVARGETDGSYKRCDRAIVSS